MKDFVERYLGDDSYREIGLKNFEDKTVDDLKTNKYDIFRFLDGDESSMTRPQTYANNIQYTEKILAKETISSMQAGLVYGQIGQTEYIVKHMIEESGYENVKVVATGGLGNLISSETKCIDIYNPNLTLYGMKFIYDKQKR